MLINDIEYGVPLLREGFNFALECVRKLPHARIHVDVYAVLHRRGGQPVPPLILKEPHNREYAFNVRGARNF